MANAEGSSVMLNRVMTKDNIALAALLETKPACWESEGPAPAISQQPLLVATAHIHWDPEFCDVKLIQTMMLVGEPFQFLCLWQCHQSCHFVHPLYVNTGWPVEEDLRGATVAEAVVLSANPIAAVWRLQFAAGVRSGRVRHARVHPRRPQGLQRTQVQEHATEDAQPFGQREELHARFPGDRELTHHPLLLHQLVLCVTHALVLILWSPRRRT